MHGLPAPAIATPEHITGVVLAGGRGRRMGGVDKGLVHWQGKPLAAHVVERLRPQVATVLISANRNLDEYRAWAPVMTDPDPAAFAGPLAGIEAAFAAITTEWLAVAPCDLPRIPLDAVTRLAAGLDGANAAYAAPRGERHSLVCLLHRSTAPALARLRAQGEHRVSAWLAAIGARAVAFADAQAFANLNALADLERAEDA